MSEKVNWSDYTPVDQPSAPANVDWSQFEPVKPAGALRRVADAGLGFVQGATGGSKALTDTAGAGNMVSGALDSVSRKAGALMSDEAQAEIANRQRLIREAEQSGSVINEIGANLGGIAEAPVRSIAQGAGSIVPTLAAAALTRGRSLLPVVGIGAAQGAGAVKGTIYDNVRQRQIEAGATPEQAELAASRAQEYRGENAGNIAVGAGLGAAASLTGAEGAILGTGQHVARGALRRIGRATGEEAFTEGAQGGQERYAGNVAEQRQGFDTPTWQGVAGQAVGEGVIGGLVGGGVGVIAGDPHQPQNQPQISPQSQRSQVGVFPSEVPGVSGGANLGGLDAATTVPLQPAAPTKSQAMGINPAVGPVSAAAAVAVDTGVTDVISRQDAEQAAAAAKQAKSTGPSGAVKKDAAPGPAPQAGTQQSPVSGVDMQSAPQPAPHFAGPLAGALRKSPPVQQQTPQPPQENPLAQSGEPIKAQADRETPVAPAPGAMATGAAQQPAAEAVRVGVADQGDRGLNDSAAPANRKIEGVDPQTDEITFAEPGASAQSAAPAVSAAATKDAQRPAAPIDLGAHTAATSPLNDTPEPTQAQKEAGNYKKAHLVMSGLDISIENPEGSTRSGVDPDGKPWSTTMTGGHYGYVRGSVGSDGDQQDVFVKPGTPLDYSGPVFVIDQIDPKTGKHDEYKSMIGYDNALQARQAYQKNYAKGWKGLKSIESMDWGDFKTWVRDTPDKRMQDEFERLYQEDVKDGIRARLGLRKQEASPIDAPKPSAFRSFLRNFGIKPANAADITGERGFKANARMPGTFRKSGLELDDLAHRAVEYGYLTQQDIDSVDDNGGVNKLVEMIRAELRGEKQVSLEFSDEDAQAESQRRMDMEIEDAARSLGIPEDPDMDTARLASMVSRVQRALDAARAGKKGELKDERIRRNAIAVAQRIEAKRAQYENELAEFANATIKEQNAVIDVFFDDDGMPVLVRPFDVAAEDAWNRTLGTWEDQNGQTDSAEVTPARQAGPPDATGKGKGVGDDQETRAETQRGDSGGQGSQEGSDQEILTSPTRGDVLAQQDRVANAQTLDDKAQIDREASTQTLTAQTAPEQRRDTTGDMFGVEKAQAVIDKRNASGTKSEGPSLFDQPAEPEAAAAARAPTEADALRLPFGDFASQAQKLIDMPGGSWLLLDNRRASYETGSFSVVFSWGNGKWSAGDTSKTPANAYATALRTWTDRGNAPGAFKPADKTVFVSGAQGPDLLEVAAAHKVGDLAKLTKPGVNGRVNIAGTITKILPDGRLEIRTQQDGYMTVAPSELGHKPTAAPAASATARTRPRDTITFQTPIKGPSGSSLVSYTWQWRPMDVVDSRGEDRTVRVSDWDKADVNAETGREIVHQFVVAAPDGSTQTVSAETAVRLLGFAGDEAAPFKSATSAAKTLARLRMQAYELGALVEQFTKDHDAVKAMRAPSPTSERNAEGWFEMGDAKVRQLEPGPMIPERLRALTSAWRDNRLQERGWKSGEATKDLLGSQVADIGQRIKRAEKKVASLGDGASPATQATTILDAAKVTGKDRLDITKDVKAGALTPDEVQAAFPSAEKPQEASQPPAWHTAIPEHGTLAVPADEKNYSQIPRRVATEAVDAVTRTQSLGNMALYAYVLPAANGYHGAVRLFPDDQTPPAPWSLLFPEAVRMGMLTRDQAIDKLAEPLRRAPVLGDVKQAGKIEDVGEKIGGARKDTATSTGPKASRATDDDRPAWARRFVIGEALRPVGQINAIPNEGRWVIRDKKNTDFMGQPKQVGRMTFATKEDAEAALPLLAVSLKHRVRLARSEDGKDVYEIWRDIGERKSVKVVDRQFESNDAAKQYMAENAVSIIEANTTFGEADLPIPESKQRIGEARRSGNVTGESFRDVFGFRAVEFGNWNNQEERQQVMNEAYDGLLDLAEVMGIPPKAIGLNGDLALAFGARGQGLHGARAHYENRRAVINLTKMDGAGALAHEWFHALDHYFGRQDGKTPGTWKTGADGTRTFDAKGGEADMASGGFLLRGSGVRKEIQDAYQGMVKTMFKKAATYVEDTEKADQFVAATREQLAEQLNKLRAELSAQKDVRYYKRKNAPAPAEMLAEFDEIASKFLAGEFLDTEIRYNDANKSKRMTMAHRWTNDALDKINAIYKETRGRSGFNAEQNGWLDGLRGYMTRYSQRLKMLADAQQATEKTKSVPTEFAMDAKSLDQGRGKDYWTTPHEMLARAFQGYVEDKIAEKGGKSPFLNYAPANSGILTPWGWKRPYPYGEERKAINGAIDKFVKALETQETEGGNVLIREPDAPYEADLFGDPLPAAPARPAPAGPGRAAVRRNVQPVAGVQDTPAPAGEYFASTIVGSEVSRELGASRITKPEHAAQATTYLYKSAVERMDGIVTDKDGKVLAIVGGFKGAISQTSVYPATLMAEAVRVPGAANIWFSHNHPSGQSNLSTADRNLNQVLSDVFRGSGIEPQGLLAIAGETFSHVSPSGNVTAETAIAPSIVRNKVPVIERELSDGSVSGLAIGSPGGAKSIARLFFDKAREPGLILLNSQNNVIAWVPISDAMKGNLRGTGQLNALYRAISQANAANAIIVHGGDLNAVHPTSRHVSIYQNIGAALRNVDVRPLDSINVKDGTSAAESGMDIALGPVYARNGKTRNTESIAAVHAIIDPITTNWSVPVVVVATPGDLPIDAPDDARGLYHKGTVYLVASTNPTRALVLKTLMHEAVAHHGLRTMLGREAWRKMMNQIAFAVKAGNKPLREISGYVRRTYVDEDGKFNLTPTQEADEIAARAVEQGVDPITGEFKPGFGWLKAVFAKVAQFLRDIGFSISFSNVELQGALVNAMRGLNAGPRKPFAGKEAMAARNGKPLTEYRSEDTPDGDQTVSPKAAAQIALLEARYKAQREAQDKAQESEGGDTPIPDWMRTGQFARGGGFASAKSLSDVTNTLREATRPIGTVSWWDKTVGTQFHKSTKDADFKRVFDGYVQQTDDTAHYAIEAERNAPDILRRIESIGDAFRGVVNAGAKHKTDLVAVSRALFANIEGEEGIKQFRYDDQSLRQIFNMTPRQIEMYHQARTAVDTSIARLAQTYAAQLGQSNGMDIESVKNMDLDDTIAVVKEFIQDSHDEARAAEALRKDVAVEDQDPEGDETRELMRESGKKPPKAPTQEMTDALMKRLDAMGEHAKFLQQSAYMPALRFGQFAVTVTGKDDQTLHFEMFESQIAANIAAMKLRKQYPGAEVTKSVMNPEQYAMFKGVSPETVELFAKFTGADQNEAFQNYIALAKSARSVKMRELKRKGIAGFSEDATRVLAAFLTSNARQSAINMNIGQITDALASKELARKGDVQREAQKLHEYMANPIEEARRLRSFMFMHFMGGSIASALVNLTQPVMQTTPYLHQWAGSRTAGIMLAAAKMAATGKIEDQGLRDAAKRAAEDGITEPHEIHQLMADASGSSFGGNLRARAAVKLWGSFFSAAEAYNRRVTFLAAYQVARKTNQKDPYEFARRAVIETQGLYSKVNRPNWARGAVGATIFTFKQFSIAYMEWFTRLPPKQKALAMAILLIAAGAEGLPFAEDLQDLIDTVGQSLGYNTNSKKWQRRILAQTFGDDLGEILNTGLLSKSAVDVQGRLGMGNLIPGTEMFKPSETDKTRSVSELAGPVSGVLTAFQKALAKVQRGEIGGYTGAVHELAPVALKNLLKGIDMAGTGVYKDARGYKVADVDALDSFVKMLGLQPSSIARNTRKFADELQDKGMVVMMERMIADRWAQGVAEKDQDQVAKARQALIKWNENNPESRIVIKPQQILRRVQEREKTRTERFVKTVPRELRASVAAELQ